MKPADISVVVPTLNEAETIERCVQSAQHAGAEQIIIADGGSIDATVDAAQRAGATDLVHSDPGRGIQMNQGAALATNEMILFLHADNRLSGECLNQICDHPGLVWGAFRQRIDAPHNSYRGLEFGNAMRVSVRGMPFGDQAIFVRREVFEQQGRFAELPLMEDVDFSRRMRKLAKPALLDGPVIISARRWQENGIVRQTFRNWMIQVAYKCGVSTDRLAEFYRRDKPE